MKIELKNNKEYIIKKYNKIKKDIPSMKIKEDKIIINTGHITKWKFIEKDNILEIKKEITILEIIRYIVIWIIDIMMGVLLLLPEIHFINILLIMGIIILETLFFIFFDYKLPIILLRDEYIKKLDQ